MSQIDSKGMSLCPAFSDVPAHIPITGSHGTLCLVTFVDKLHSVVLPDDVMDLNRNDLP